MALVIITIIINYFLGELFKKSIVWYCKRYKMIWDLLEITNTWFLFLIHQSH